MCTTQRVHLLAASAVALLLFAVAVPAEASTITPGFLNGTTFDPGSGSRTWEDLTDPGSPDMPANAAGEYLNGFVTSTTLPGFGGQNFGNVFTNTNSKMCCSGPTNSVTFQFNASNSYIIDGYTLTSSNDSPQRDPVDWTLSGSNDGSSFTPIHTVVGTSNAGAGNDTIWTGRNQTILFEGAGIDFTTPATAYEYVRFEYTRIDDGGNGALNEIELFSDGAIAPPDVIPPPGTKLGTGAGALAHNTVVNGRTVLDLTDPENDATTNSLNINGTVTATFSPGSPGSTASNHAHNLFENVVGTEKWCCTGGTQSVTFELEVPMLIDAFTLASGNDVVARDPLDWQLLGSTDGVIFDPIFTYANEDHNDLAAWNARNQVVLFDENDFSPPPGIRYSHIRFEVTQTGGGQFQLGEIELFGVPEPSSLVLLLGLGMASGLRSRRRR